MSIELEHRLLWQVETSRCIHGHEVPLYTTETGRCLCGWSCWSKYKDEILEAHQHHWDFVRRKEAEKKECLREQATSQHEIRWNETRDAAFCSWCDWRMQSSNTARVFVAWNHHLENVEKCKHGLN